MMRHNLELAGAADVTTLSLLRGLEDYKLRWRPETVLDKRVVLPRPGSVLAAGHLAAVRGEARLRPWLKERAPWVKEARRRALRVLGR